MNVSELDSRPVSGAACALLCATLFVACSGATQDERVPDGAAGAHDGAAGDSGASGSGAEAAPVYALTTNVWGDDGATGYLYTLGSLSEGEASLDDAIEIPGGAWIYGREGDRHVYVSSGELGPVLKRFEVRDDGRLIEGPSISFAPLGLTQAPRFGAAQILSEEKAYLVDSVQQLVAIWNPRDMQISSVIELDVEPRGGLPAWIAKAMLRGGTLFLTAVWELDWQFGEASRLIAIDTATDEIVETRDETRCEQLAIGSLSSDGTAYYSAYAHSPAARLVLGPEYGTRSCGLRIVPSGATLDDAWEVDLSALAGGRPAGEFVLASDDVAFFRAYYAEEVGATAETWQDEQGAPAFRWWRWIIGAETAEEVPNQELTVEAAHYVVGGKTYVGNPSADWAKTTVVELDPAGALREGVTLSGTPGGIVKTR